MFSFNHFNFNVSDLDKSLAFYREALGLTEVRRTVAEDGTITAVAPGTAIVTVTSGTESRTCIVRCNWKAQEKPEEKPAEKPEEKPADTSVDLKAFYDATIAAHTFQTLQEFTGDVLETYYQVLFAADPASIGGALPYDSFYYGAA